MGHPSKSSHSRPDENSLNVIARTRNSDWRFDHFNPQELVKNSSWKRMHTIFCLFTVLVKSSNRTVPDSIVSSTEEPKPISRNAPDCAPSSSFEYSRDRDPYLDFLDCCNKGSSRVYIHYCPSRKLKEGIILLTFEKAVKEDVFKAY
ncbi:hypothetical protein M9H77_27112 [Catharanthus roseus]|uniref:Uncharacterized protein n=1 Tax=Catharanthus roseus TaxID=4058 RepID=A0ACC0ADR9_CATRO|nr:hypothetical protein M9H77_27112 [Catharanthus roseus]